MSRTLTDWGAVYIARGLAPDFQLLVREHREGSLSRPQRMANMIIPPTPPPSPIVAAGDEDESLVMPFGKHAGVPVAELPASYLCWLIGHIQLRSQRLATAVIEAHGLYCDDPHDEKWSEL